MSVPFPGRMTVSRRLFRLLLLAWAPLAAPGCRRGGVVEPPYDAAAIVEGSAPPAMHADTIADATADPFTVQIERARWSSRAARPVAGRDFWDDIAVLELPAAERAATSVEQRTFALALRSLMAGEPEDAAVAFGILHAQAADPIVRARARIGLTMALSWRSDWKSLASIGEDPDSVALQLEPGVVQAGVERWARALADLPAPELTIPDVPSVVPMRRSAFGTPLVEVRINGRPYEFWLDTGASMTLLSTTVAVESKVLLASPDTLALGVVVGHIPARAVLIDSLAIGPMRAHGISAALVSPASLRLDRMERDGVVRTVQIDGVIGTDLLRHLDVVLDASAGTMTIRRPRRDPRATRNLFWVGYPVVKLVSREGPPLLFGLDTGAEGTFVTMSLLRKLPRTPVGVRPVTLGGLGTGRERTRWVAREVALSDGDYAITLHNAPVTPGRQWTFVNFDGVIGSDVALGSRMHLDFTNGVFDIRPPQR